MAISVQSWRPEFMSIDIRLGVRVKRLFVGAAVRNVEFPVA